MQWKFWKNEKPESGDRVIFYDMTEDTYAIFTYVDSKKGDKRPYILDTEGYSLGCIDDDVYNTKIAWCKIGDCIILTEDEIEEIENLVILHVVNPENKVSYNTKGYWKVVDNNNNPLDLYGEYDGLDIKKQYTIEQLRYALREE